MKQNSIKKLSALILSLTVLAMVFIAMKTSANENDANTKTVSIAIEAVSINETNFPDDIFRDWILQNIEGASDTVLTAEELSKVTVMYLNNGSWIIKDLKGIEYFTSLQELFCPGIGLEKIDLSKNLELKKLNCDGNKIRKLDVTNNTKLEILSLYLNEHLSEIKLGANKELWFLVCDDCYSLTSIDISQCTKLKALQLRNCALESVDVSQNSLLESFSYHNNRITMVDISQNPLIKKHEYEPKDGYGQKIAVSMLKSETGYVSEKEYTFAENVTFSNAAVKYKDNKLTVDKVTRDMTCTFDAAWTDKTAEISGTITFTADSYFEPVTSLINVPQSMVAMEPLMLQGDVVPANASKQKIIWSIKDTGSTKAVLENGQLLAKQAGTLILTATIKDGAVDGDYTQDFTITVSKPKEYTIIFDTGDGTFSEVQVVVQSKVAIPDIPVKEGYIFSGWYQDSKYQNLWDFDTLITKDYHLYAKWIKMPMVEAVESNIASGSVDKNSQIILHSNTKGASIYYTDDGSIPTNQSILYTKPISITKNVTIKAISIKNQHIDSIVSTFHYTIKEGIKKIEVESHNDNTIELIDEAEVLEAILTKEDLLAQQAGKNIFVTLKCTPLKQSTIPLETSILSNMIVGQYIDITLLKQIEDDHIQEMAELSKPIKIKLEIPENLWEQDREYKVVRYHEGEWTILEDLDNDSTTITIASDKFSVYAIVYQDEKQDTANHINSIDSIPTSDTSQIGLYIVLGCLSFTLLIYLLYKICIHNNDKILVNKDILNNRVVDKEHL